MYLIYCNDEIVAKFYGRQYAEIVEEIVLNNSTPNEVWEAEWVEVETFCLARRWRYWTYILFNNLKIALDKRAFFVGKFIPKHPGRLSWARAPETPGSVVMAPMSDTPGSVVMKIIFKFLSKKYCKIKLDSL